MGLEIDKEKIESITQTNIKSIGPLPNPNDQKKSINCVDFETKDMVMDTYNSVGKLLDKLDVVNKETRSICEKNIIDRSEKVNILFNYLILYLYKM